jgi:HK97 family phage major capsid protein
MTEEEKKAQLEKDKQEALENVKKTAEEAAKGVAEKSVKELNDKVTELTTQLEKATKSEDIEAVKKELTESINKLSADVKKQSQITVPAGEVTAMGAIKKSLEQTIRDNADALKNYRSGTLDLTVKAISEASFGANDYASLTTERLPMYKSPYAPVYLRNIFPNISTSSSNLAIWKQGAVTGAAAIWQRGTGVGGVDVDKPEVTPTWEKEVVSVDWIAGITHIPKEILEDVDFMATEIPYALIYGASGILAAENKMILDYIASKAVDFTLPTGVGAFENSLESVLAAAYGQLGDNYMAPTHILINNWDYLKFLAFNKASGSGQYNYPNMTLTFANNQMFINNLQAVPATGVAPATAYVISADHSRFVSRQGLQMDMSESHADNFTKNMVTYRAEVRSGFFTYNDKSFVKVALPTPAVTP